VFSALADPTRRDMVARLAGGDATVNELAEPYDVTVQAVSKHLKAEVFDMMTKWIERYQRRAEERYSRLDEVLRTMPDELEHTPSPSARGARP
jgi:DNA-binding transcriptional ArsR family regulator